MGQRAPRHHLAVQQRAVVAAIAEGIALRRRAVISRGRRRKLRRVASLWLHFALRREGASEVVCSRCPNVNRTGAAARLQNFAHWNI